MSGLDDREHVHAETRLWARGHQVAQLGAADFSRSRFRCHLAAGRQAVKQRRPDAQPRQTRYRSERHVGRCSGRPTRKSKDRVPTSRQPLLSGTRPRRITQLGDQLLNCADQLLEPLLLMLMPRAMSTDLLLR